MQRQEERPRDGEEREADAPATETEPPAPVAAGGVFRQRHPKALRLELAVGGILVGATALATFVAAALLTTLVVPTPLFLVLAAAVTVAACFPALLLPRWRHRRYRYRADNRGLQIQQGIWWRSHRLIPRSRLQHTDVAQGPLERHFGLASLVVHTAGTHEARTHLTGLSLEQARKVRDRLTGETEAGADGV